MSDLSDSDYGIDELIEFLETFDPSEPDVLSEADDEQA